MGTEKVRRPKNKQFGEKFLCSRQEAAHRLDCDPSQVNHLINEGLIKAFLLDGQKITKVVVPSIYQYLGVEYNGTE